MRYGDVTFDIEPIGAVWDELRPLTLQHNAELEYPLFSDCPLAINEPAYESLESAGCLKFFTVRNDAGELVGYAVFCLSCALDRRYLKQAHEGGLFLLPAYRKGRVAIKLLDFCDDVLAAEGCDMVLYNSPAIAPKFGQLLSRLGYAKVDEVYARRL